MKINAFIEILSTFVVFKKRELNNWDLYLIGDFTRENISSWLDRGSFFEAGVYGYEDFHAVCGDIDIPWSNLTSPNVLEKASINTPL